MWQDVIYQSQDIQSTKEVSGNLQPIPDRLVVLTFDDSVKSQATYRDLRNSLLAQRSKFVAPLLQEYGFGATFFVTDDPRFRGDRYMTWEQIHKLHEAGFEIGNHSARHVDVSKESREQFIADLEQLEQRCREHGIPRPTTFCYPAYRTGQEAIAMCDLIKYVVPAVSAQTSEPGGRIGDIEKRAAMMVMSKGGVEGGLVWVSDKNSATRASMCVDANGGRVDFYGNDGQTRAAIGVDKNGTGTVNAWDKNGNKLY